MIAAIKQQAEEANQPLPMPEENLRAMLMGVMGDRPFIEGAWMTKHNGKYYLQYAIPGTEYNVYGDGVYVSDKPLGPFAPANNNPYSYKPGGFINGAGHGSTLEDKNGDLWHIASMRISHTMGFERRLGLWKADFDKDGELLCDQRFGDWPIAMDAKPFDKPDWMLLSYGKPVEVSSGEGAECITDEDIRTFWKAETNRPGEWAELDLGAVYEVHAVQLNFGDDGLVFDLPEGAEPKNGLDGDRYLDMVKQPTRWLLECSCDGENYTVIEDKRNTDTDFAHEYMEFDEAKQIRFLRLYVEQLPYGQPACVSGLRVFGKGNGTAPKAAEDVEVNLVSDLDMTVTWTAEKDANANILWGYAPNKLYHSKMIFGAKTGNVGALVKGQPLYVRVDTFNETGITEGEVIPVINE